MYSCVTWLSAKCAAKKYMLPPKLIEEVFIFIFKYININKGLLFVFLPLTFFQFFQSKDKFQFYKFMSGFTELEENCQPFIFKMITTEKCFFTICIKKGVPNPMKYEKLIAFCIMFCLTLSATGRGLIVPDHFCNI